MTDKDKDTSVVKKAAFMDLLLAKGAPALATAVLTAVLTAFGIQAVSPTPTPQQVNSTVEASREVASDVKAMRSEFTSEVKGLREAVLKMGVLLETVVKTNESDKAELQRQIAADKAEAQREIAALKAENRELRDDTKDLQKRVAKLEAKDK